MEELVLLDYRPRVDRNENVSRKLRSFFTVDLTRLLGDTPARALSKNIKCHHASFFCEKCQSQGCRIGRTGMSIYKVDAMTLDLREDDKFFEYTEHVIQVSSVYCTSLIGCMRFRARAGTRTFRRVLDAVN